MIDGSLLSGDKSRTRGRLTVSHVATPVYDDNRFSVVLVYFGATSSTVYRNVRECEITVNKT